jgi:pimeloyl-ACP methyl ester carboxylesterase
MRLRALRRLPIAFGWLTMRGDAATGRWMKPVLTQPGIRRDAVQVLRAIAADSNLLLEAAECLPGFDHPALVVWARGDRVMPPDHGRRLAELLPQGQLVEVDDSYTLIPLDQPARLAQLIREFTHIRHKLAITPRNGSSGPALPRHPVSPGAEAMDHRNQAWADHHRE